MFRHWVTSMTVGVAVFLWAASAGVPGWAQHGGGGHGGGGHGGGGHGGIGHYGGFGHYVGYGHYGGLGHDGGLGHGLGYGGHFYADHGYGDYGYHGGYSHYDFPSYFSLSYGPWYGYYGYAYDDVGPRYQVAAYGSDSDVPYVSVAQGCGSRGSCGGSGPGEPFSASSLRSGRSAVGAEMTSESDYQRGATEAFRAGNYDLALRLGNHALVETPRNGKLHLFVSQILFAKGNYEAATAAIHQAASLLEPKDWGYVVENFREYYRNKDYVTQMAALTQLIEASPDAAYARFLRGYHYGYLGHKEAARRELAKAVELEGRDKLAVRLLEMFGGETPPRFGYETHPG